MAKPVLGYWDIRGLAQPIRLLLKHAAIDFDERRYSVRSDGKGGWDRSDWTAEKHTLGLDLPNLPYWIEGALKITQSDAVLLHAAKRARLMGSTDEARARALMLHGFAGDLRGAYVNFSYGPGGDAARAAFVSGPLAGAVAELEAFAAKTAGPFLLGAELTFVDFVWYDLLEQMETLAPSCLEAAPQLRVCCAAVAALPSVAAYRASPDFIDRPYNNAMATFK